MSPIPYTDRDRNGAFPAFHRVGIPACGLAFDPTKAGDFPALLRRTPPNHDGHDKGELFLLQELDNRDVEERSIQQHPPDFQADFADPGHQSPQHGHHRMVPLHPGQGERVTMPVLHDAGRSLGVKLRRALLGLAIVEFVSALVRLPVVGLQMPVDRHVPRTSPHASR